MRLVRWLTLASAGVAGVLYVVAWWLWNGINDAWRDISHG